MRKLTSGEKRYDLRDVIGGTQRSNKMANREDRLEDSESSDNFLDESSDSTGTYYNESGNSDAEVEGGPIPCRHEPVRVRQNGGTKQFRRARQWLWRKCILYPVWFELPQCWTTHRLTIVKTKHELREKLAELKQKYCENSIPVPVCSTHVTANLACFKYHSIFDPFFLLENSYQISSKWKKYFYHWLILETVNTKLPKISNIKMVKWF